jgi:sterol desaturase/sphingolipid hydroxylase (fatty acid hydroxylase superfamily)
MRVVLNAAASLVLGAIGLLTAPELVLGLAIAAAIGMSCEVLAPLHEGRRSPRGWLVDLTHAVGDRAVVIPLVALGLALLRPVVRAAVPSSLLAGVDRLPAAAEIALIVVVVDFVNYWTHRTLHRVRTLWAFHAVHHSSERLDWLATSREHPVELALNIVAVTLPTIALGEVAMAPWLLTLFFVYPFVTHANVKLRAPRLGRVLVTPAFHHWHHAVEERAHDKNFGMLLSLWDHLFGTAIDEAEFPARYGIEPGDLARADYVGHLTGPFRSLLSSPA